jgi:hypothetical protein
MKRFLFAIFGTILLAACGGAPPAPLSLEEIPGAFQKGFQNAKEETKMVIQGISRQVEKRQLGPASFQLQNFMGDRGLTKEQNSLIARALISVNAELNKQIEVQEAAVAATPSALTTARPQAAPQLPSENQADPEATAAAKRMREIYRATK